MREGETLVTIKGASARERRGDLSADRAEEPAIPEMEGCWTVRNPQPKSAGLNSITEEVGVSIRKNCTRPIAVLVSVAVGRGSIDGIWPGGVERISSLQNLQSMT
jgi:hypothetical protein